MRIKVVIRETVIEYREKVFEAANEAEARQLAEADRTEGWDEINGWETTSQHTRSEVAEVEYALVDVFGEKGAGR